MIRNRMPDLVKLAETYPYQYNEPEVQKDVPLSKDLETLFKRVGKVVKFLSQMKEIMKELHNLQEKLLLSSNHDEERRCRDLVDKLSSRFGSFARKTNSILRRFEVDEDVMRHYAAETTRTTREVPNGIEMTPTDEAHITWHRLPSGKILPLSSSRYIPAQVRMHFYMHNVLSYDLSCIVREYYIVQKLYGDKCKEKIRRQMDIIGREIEDSELEESVSRRERLPLLHADIMDDTVISEEMTKKLREVESFQQEILNLERNIEDLHKFFVTMSTLVYEQSDIINHIENHVCTAADYVEGSTELLKKARSYTHKYRKKKCILAVCVVVLLAVIIIIIVATVKKPAANSQPATQIVVVPDKTYPYRTE